MAEFRDVNELLDIARSINEGNYDVVDVDVTPESELYHIADYFSQAVKKLRTVSSAIEDAYEDLPGFSGILNSVIDESKEASESVLECVDKINFNIDDIKENITLLRKYAEAGDFNKMSGVIDRLRDKGVAGQDVSFDIIASLEFQDITKQKIDKLIKIIYDLQERLTHLVLMLGIKEKKIDVETLEKLKEKDGVVENQNLVDELLNEFGV
ncbi:protein phosphatase CheZ [Limisalsivibrio acetivorans]|uniref:protein phosphatase CheZ n=1 Tax=Limisalsivibrio acetivorans TaxID=1304888 RepID=UPI00041964B2|nr:protein phosphatase CheZ [Limisalsivibrio acetivorans]